MKFKRIIQAYTVGDKALTSLSIICEDVKLESYAFLLDGPERVTQERWVLVKTTRLGLNS